MNWLPTSDRVESCIPNIVFKYRNLIVQEYIHEIFKSLPWRCNTRSQMALGIILRKTNTGKKAYSF